jgi:hypothetical protein
MRELLNMLVRHVGSTTPTLRLFRRSIRPLVLALLRALPSPEKCGCQARKEWMIRQIEAI